MIMEKKAIYESLNAIATELSKYGISKDRKNQHQGYMFRGIDEVYNVVSSILAANKVIIKPDVTEHSRHEVTNTKGTLTFYHYIKIKYTVLSLIDGSTIESQWVSESMDTSDKGLSKALSNAYKTLLFQLFCIPIEGVNPEDDDHQVTASDAQKIPTFQDVIGAFDHSLVSSKLRELHLKLHGTEMEGNSSEAFFNSQTDKMKQSIFKRLSDLSNGG